MTRNLLLAFAVGLLFSPAPASAADAPLPDGKYFLSMFPRVITGSRMALIEVKSEDGKLAVETLDSTNNAEVKNLRVENGLIKADIELGANKLTFEGKAFLDKEKRLLGSVGNDKQAYVAQLISTDANQLGAGRAVMEAVELPDEVQMAQRMKIEPALLRSRALRTADAEEKKKLQIQAAEASEKLEEELPGLLRKLFTENPNSPAMAFAVTEMFDQIDVVKPTPQEATKWAEAMVAYAAMHGPRYEQSVLVDLASKMAGSKEIAPVALGFTEKAIAQANDASTDTKIRLLKALATGQEALGKKDDLVKTKAEIDKLELVLDKEYLETVPPFKVAKFEGRKDDKANQVVLMELFTGTQCPPCVAADVAFDGLLKAYQPQDVVLLQYHMHIPGPDPLTNPDSEARFKYYRGLFPANIRGTPSTLFNGNPEAGGGGGMSNSQNKFGQYTNVIDPLLEDKAEVELAGSAKKDGETVTAELQVKAEDLPESATVKLVLVEKNIRYVGSNGVRFHHNVVRSYFGNVEGTPVKDLKDGKHEGTVKLGELREALAKYLDDYAKNNRPFPYPDRPLDLDGLAVIAFVQDNATGKVFQAVQFNLE